MWRNFTLLLAVVIFILILALALHTKNIVTFKEIYTNIPLQRYIMSKERDNIKAGDIIYMGNSISPAQDLLIPYIYKHIGIIVKFNDTLYIADSSNKSIIGRRNKTLISRVRGVDIYPLEDRLRNTIGATFISKLNKPLTEEKNNILQQTIREKIGEPYPSLAKLYTLFILNIPIKTTLYCHTLVYICLLNMKLISNIKRDAYEIGNLVTSISEYQLNDGYKYEPPKQLVYDNECEDADF